MNDKAPRMAGSAIPARLSSSHRYVDGRGCEANYPLKKGQLMVHRRQVMMQTNKVAQGCRRWSPAEFGDVDEHEV